MLAVRHATTRRAGSHASTTAFSATTIQEELSLGQLHGAGLIAVGLIFLRPHPSPFTVFSSIFLVVLGICVLRRNKLILPLMIAWPLSQLFWVVTHPGVYAWRRPLFPLIAWWFYIVYYYRRRNEFVNWV